jgi:hypothetical protein
MKRNFIFAAGCMLLLSWNNEKKNEARMDDGIKTTMSTADKKPASELLDIGAGDAVKASYVAFSKGDVDGMTANYDDNIRYTWSGGDSLIGKQAVKDYYNGK